jgi:hypothetical protein
VGGKVAKIFSRAVVKRGNWGAVIVALVGTCCVLCPRIPKQDLSLCNNDTYARSVWTGPTPIYSTAKKDASDVQRPNQADLSEACVLTQVKSYIDTDYGATQDLAKVFLTLITATFVASVAFSEKIFKWPDPSGSTAVAMRFSWGLSLAATVSCGSGIAINLISLYRLKYRLIDPEQFQRVGRIPFVFPALCFGMSLANMLIATRACPIPQESPVKDSDQSAQTRDVGALAAVATPNVKTPPANLSPTTPGLPTPQQPTA